MLQSLLLPASPTPTPTPGFLGSNPNLSLSAQLIIFFLVKILFILGAVLYLVFAFVVIRQIAVMKNTLITPFSPIITLIGYIHFLLALAMLILFIILL